MERHIRGRAISGMTYDINGVAISRLRIKKALCPFPSAHRCLLHLHIYLLSLSNHCFYALRTIDLSIIEPWNSEIYRFNDIEPRGKPNRTIGIYHRKKVPIVKHTTWNPFSLFCANETAWMSASWLFGVGDEPLSLKNSSPVPIGLYDCQLLGFLACNGIPFPHHAFPSYVTV